MMNFMSPYKPYWWLSTKSDQGFYKIAFSVLSKVFAVIVNKALILYIALFICYIVYIAL